jgi:hypothetical protein
MAQDFEQEKATASFEQIAYSNMLIVQALVELLSEKGLLQQQEVLDRVKKLKQETGATRLNGWRQANRNSWLL